jgi:hypothetical protein
MPQVGVRQGGACEQLGQLAKNRRSSRLRRRNRARFRRRTPPNLERWMRPVEPWWATLFCNTRSWQRLENQLFLRPNLDLVAPLRSKQSHHAKLKRLYRLDLVRRNILGAIHNTLTPACNSCALPSTVASDQKKPSVFRDGMSRLVASGC